MPVCPECKSLNFGQLQESHFFKCSDCGKLFELNEFVEVKKNGGENKDKTRDKGI